jgi:hypothetical protein
LELKKEDFDVNVAKQYKSNNRTLGFVPNS